MEGQNALEKHREVGVWEDGTGDQKRDLQLVRDGLTEVVAEYLFVLETEGRGVEWVVRKK